MTPENIAIETSSDPPLVFIVVLSWNDKNDTIECLESLHKLEYPNFIIVVIANGSTDGSEDVIRSLFPMVDVVETGTNLGFAGGNNVGIRYALLHGADYVWLLNSDTTVEPNALIALVATAKADTQIAFVGSKIYYDNKLDVIWCVGGTVDLAEGGSTGHPGIGEVDRGQFEKITDVGYVSGCSLLASKAAILAVGLIPEEYFLYFEETDWNISAQRKGYRTVLAPSSHVWHKYEDAGDYKDRFIYYSFRNRIHIVRKYEPRSILKAVKVNLTLLCGHISENPRRAGVLCLIACLAHLDAFLLRYGKTKWHI